MMKFAFFLVVAICAFQGYQARSVAENEITPYGWADELLTEIKKQIAHLIEKINGVVEHIKDFIKNLVKKAQEFIDRIKDIVEEAGEVGKACWEEQQGAMENLKDTVDKRISECRDQAEVNIKNIKKQMEKIQSESGDVISGIKKCLKGPVNELIPCMKEELEPVKQIVNEVKDTIVDAEKKVVETKQCVEKATREVASLQKVIMEDMLACINKPKPY